MGVQGLWELLAPVGRRVSVDSLGNRKLAVDASIWIVQFMKAMRDENGDMIRNAHLLGFFRRICKLLYLRIKPIFVFDGATPVLKRRTLIARRKQRENAQFKIRKTAEKLLLNHIRSRKLEEIASQINSGEIPEAPNQPSSQTTEIRNESSGAGIPQGLVKICVEHGLGRSSFDEKSDQDAADALLAASLAAEYSQNTDLAENDLTEEIIEVGGEDNDVEELVLPSNLKVLDPAVLASLPASMQLELLVQMREQLVAENRQKFQKVSRVPSSFSQLQIQAYLKTVAFRREITEVQRAAGGEGLGGVPTTRIASTADREFIYSNSFQGEKPIPSMIEEQRRSQQATCGKNKEVSVSFPGSKSKLFCAITKPQKRPVERVPEEGVVSLVSTEMKEEPDSSTSCSVQTYVDEKGHIRVSRVRGMGVRMTRDLQWNLYLMKDTEARKSSESGTLSSPPVIPSNRVEDSPVPAVTNDFDSSVNKQGLQISFVDDGNSVYSKDTDLFGELVLIKGNHEDATNLQGSSLPEKNDEYPRVSNTEEEDDFEWEEGVVDKSLDCTVVEEKVGCFQVSGTSTSASIRQGHNGVDVMVRRKEGEEGQNGDRGEHVLFGGGVDHSVVEDHDLAEAMKLSLMVKDEGGSGEEPKEHVILEDGPSSDESEVEWEDGTGAVTVTGFDAVTADTDISKIQSGPSEEAQIQEAIRRSLEDLRSPANVSSRLVIKEPSDENSNSVVDSRKCAILSPLLPLEAESEEIYLARERTRKGKALLGEEENIPHQYVSSISEMISAEVENSADTTLIKSACSKDAPEPVARANEEDAIYKEKEVGGTVTEPSKVPKAEKGDSVEAHGCVSVNEVFVNRLADFIPANVENEVSSSGNFRFSPKHDPNSSPNPSYGKNPPMGGESFKQGAPGTVAQNQATQSAVRNKEGSEGGLSGHFAGQVSPEAPGRFLESQPRDDAEILKDAEEMDIAKDREDLRVKEAQVLFEREQLAREEEKLQAELQAEREEIEAGLDKERELLAREEMELRAVQKKNERNAESVTGEMFSDVQELLRMFGLPYVEAPMEAEAQCAYMDETNLVDGVVTEDSDVFLFGARNVYKNLFDDRKYVETYYMKDLESEMGMNREKLIRMALLLGSDYTEGISGIGIVNAIEVVRAFEEEDGLQKFRMAIDSPDLSLFNKIRGLGKVKSTGKGRAKGKASGDEGEHVGKDEVSEGGDLDRLEDKRFSYRQRIFLGEHRAVSKNWNIPDSFPSAAVIAAYVSPMVDKSKESFSFGRPDLEALRRFCYDKFGWNKDKADELLLPVLKEYDRRETQTRLDSFFHFSQRFAKIRSRRIQKAVTGITGRRSEDLMDFPPHLLISTPHAKSMKRSRTSKTSGFTDEMNKLSGLSQVSSLVDGEPTSTPDRAQAGVGTVERGRKGIGRGRKRVLASAGEVEDERDVGSGEDGQNLTTKKTHRRDIAKSSSRGRSKGGGRGRGRGRGRRHDSESDANGSDASKNDEITEDYMGEMKSSERKASLRSPAIQRATRRPSEKNYMLDNSDEDAAGACSDGEIQAAKVSESCTHVMKETSEGPHASSSEPSKGLANMDLDRPVSKNLSEVHDHGTGGGFCQEENEGSVEAELSHCGKDEPSYLERGGGFCLDENEVSPKSLDSGMPGVRSLEQQPRFTLGGGFSLLEDEEEVLRKASELAERHCRNQEMGSEHLETSKVVNSDSLSSCRLVINDATPSMKHPQNSGEPVELGLRAMPMMKRKKRKSG